MFVVALSSAHINTNDIGGGGGGGWTITPPNILSLLPHCTDTKPPPVYNIKSGRMHIQLQVPYALSLSPHCLPANKNNYISAEI